MKDANRLELGIQHRTFDVRKDDVSRDNLTVDVKFSSDAEVPRFFGVEILGHKKGEVNVERIADGRAPVLVGHDQSDQVGVVEKASIDHKAGVGRATLRFGRSARATEILNDIEDGIRSQISVGYRVGRMVLQDSSEDREVFRAVDWTPVEISVVAVAADPSAGVGRSDGHVPATVIERGGTMPEPTPTPAPAPAPVAPEPIVKVRDLTDDERKKAEQGIRDQEGARVREIFAAGAAWDCPDDAQRAITEGTSVTDFKTWILENKMKKEPEPLPTRTEPEPIGLTDQEVEGYSLIRAIKAKASGDWTDAGFELEASRAMAKRVGEAPRGFFVPPEVLKRWATDALAKRALTTGGSGGNLVAANLLAGSFIDLLRANSVVMQLGATTLDGLVGNVDIPRQTTAATFGWVAEEGTTTLSDQVYDQVSLTPKTLTAGTQMSRRMLLQSTPAIEGLVRDDLVRVMALAIDDAAIEGTGAGNQPTGIVNQTGVDDQGSFTESWATIVAFESAVAAANALGGSLGWALTATARGTLKTLAKDAGSGLFVMEGDTLVGYATGIANQLAQNLGVGLNEHRIVFGNWTDLLIGMWGTLDVNPDPFGAANQAALIIRTFQDIDIAVRHGESFSIGSFVP